MATKKQSISYSVHAHDHFFRMAMREKRVAKEFFEAHLPADLCKDINLSQLEMEPGSYIDDLRRESIADILFKTEIKGHDAYLYLVVDHQSRPDALMPFRMLKYTCNIIDQFLKTNEGKKIPLVLPLVVYHGKAQWHYSTDIADLVDAPKTWVDQYFLQPFTLIDLNLIDDEILKKRIWVGAMELTLKPIFQKDMQSTFEDILLLLKEIERLGGGPFTEIVLMYILDKAELKNKEIFLKLVKSELSEEVGEKMMTLREQFKAEGVEQGIQAGMQQGRREGELIAKTHMVHNMLKESYSVSVIAKLTELTEQDIVELAKTCGH